MGQGIHCFEIGCHSERSEESRPDFCSAVPQAQSKIPRFARNDISRFLGARQAQRGTPCQAFELVGKQGSIRGHHNDYGTLFLIRARVKLAPNFAAGDFLPDGHAGNPQLLAGAAIALHQDSHRVAALGSREQARGGPDASLEIDGFSSRPP